MDSEPPPPRLSVRTHRSKRWRIAPWIRLQAMLFLLPGLGQERVEDAQEGTRGFVRDHVAGLGELVHHRVWRQGSDGALTRRWIHARAPSDQHGERDVDGAEAG